MHSLGVIQSRVRTIQLANYPPVPVDIVTTKPRLVLPQDPVAVPVLYPKLAHHLTTRAFLGS